MGERANILEDWRARVLSHPELVLEDRDLMRTLLAATDRQMGDNVIDMRGIAMDRLENRLDQLEDTHRSVITVAYENLSGTNRVHRAVLTLLDQTDFEAFLKALGTDVADILRVDQVRLVLESTEVPGSGVTGVQNPEDVLTVVVPGFVNAYLAGGRAVGDRGVTLRRVGDGAGVIYGTGADWLASEALLRLDPGPNRLPGLLAFGAKDPHQFRPGQGTDLLAFFAGVVERLMRTYLD
ncbi:MAG: DUF484 family protein [Rhodobacteraceae bacterium]|nr:DUF484 family protein [Paracoccaceae bacterium]